MNTASEDQRHIAQTICSTKEYEAWHAIHIHGMTLRATANLLGISHTSVRDRLDNAQRKINSYSRDDFPQNLPPLESKDPDAPIRIIIGLLIQRDGPNCYLCQRPIPADRAHVEHIIPTAHGGTDDPENIALACDECNTNKGSKFVSQRATSGRPVYHSA